MFYWAIVFLILSLIGAILGFTVLGWASVGIGKLVFAVLNMAFMVVLIKGFVRRKL